ncbi:MAG: ankyrin repeat domain-containing protein [Myxococcota bacterium]
MGSAGGNWKALYEAAKAGNVDEVEFWLDAGADPNAQHVEFGSTPLIAAAENGHLAAAKVLVLGGAQLDVRSDWDKCTALEAAEAKGHSDVAAWLKEQ